VLLPAETYFKPFCTIRARLEERLLAGAEQIYKVNLFFEK